MKVLEQHSFDAVFGKGRGINMGERSLKQALIDGNLEYALQHIDQGVIDPDDPIDSLLMRQTAGRISYDFQDDFADKMVDGLKKYGLYRSVPDSGGMALPLIENEEFLDNVSDVVADIFRDELGNKAGTESLMQLCHLAVAEMGFLIIEDYLVRGGSSTLRKAIGSPKYSKMLARVSEATRIDRRSNALGACLMVGIDEDFVQLIYQAELSKDELFAALEERAVNIYKS